MKNSSDHTVFAWKAENARVSTFRGLLAHSPDSFVATLPAAAAQNQRLGVIIRKLGSDEQQYTRVNAQSLTLAGEADSIGERRPIYARQTPLIPRKFVIEDLHCFYVRPSQRSDSSVQLSTVQV
ncbi:uncharacterized protein BDR25DRAFT_318805 [Lindgomyces ingoldianus]|uniref:Uncharacterized protein n=1 Tax=Lindgomyces ingoldianus TaxID=673940 RepID=A0ACB6QG35_9PLEO|nr:uncharacterized protein BDR25DRAFT_318805 [Lindgomyces ingoldianus]KAF2465110.1 hypothetical protein BDR25DRAFT_318805 [Lindgomyces ingoldianus]